MTRVKGPKNGNILHASLNGKIKKEYPTIKETNVLLLISIVGNEYCAGDYLQASIKQALQDHHQVTVLVADDVYWHNLRYHFEDNREKTILKQHARQLGDDFIHNNISYIIAAIDSDHELKLADNNTSDEKITLINQFAKENNKSFNVIRWVDWIANKAMDFKHVKNKLYHDMETNNEMKQSIAKTATDFARRNSNEDDIILWKKRSEHYLREETAAVIWPAVYTGYHFIAYPGDIIMPFQTAKKLFFSNDISNDFPRNSNLNQSPMLANWLDIYFKRSLSKEQCLNQSINEAPFINSLQKPGNNLFFNPVNKKIIDDTQQQILKSIVLYLSSPGDMTSKLDVINTFILMMEESYSTNITPEQSTHRTKSSS